MSLPSPAQSTETVNLQGTDYELVKHIERQIGPGTVYYRYRIPTFPLNINMLTVDVSNPYTLIETTLAKDLAAGTELLTEAAKRHDAPGHRPMAAQNANFWIVSTQPQWNAYGASPHNVSLRNGMMAVDAKSLPHWWKDWHTGITGIVSVSKDHRLYIDACNTEMTFRSEKTGTRTFDACNKGFKTGQTAIYNRYFGTDRQFLPLKDDTPEQIAYNDIHYDIDEDSQCVEVLLNLKPGEEWSAGRDIIFEVAEVRHGNGRGTLGSHDLAIVTRGEDLAVLQPGDELALNYSWEFDIDGTSVRPEIVQAVGGNTLVMHDGEITEQNYWDSYNTMVYSRAAYGCSKDSKTLYMVVIDKSSDPEYGQSDGCVTAVMCDLMRHFGCWNLVNVDAGGSAELMIGDRIINRTTEGTPRAVNNGWMIFNTAPEDDNEVASLAFEAVTLSAPCFTSFSPRVISYNRYGTVLDYDYRDYTVSVGPELGTGSGNTLHAGTTATRGTITVSAPNGASVSKEIEIVEATPRMRLSEITVDSNHPYRLEVVADANGREYAVEPTRVAWRSDNESVAQIDGDGVLHAVENGTTRIRGEIGNYTFETVVNVQNPSATELTLCDDWSKWTAKGNTGLKDVVLGADGRTVYTYNSPRGQSAITLSYTTQIYGIPERIVVDFTHDLPVESIEMDIRTSAGKKNVIKASPEGGYTANEEHSVEFPVSLIGDPDDFALYPLTFYSIKFNTTADNSYKGSHTLAVRSIRAEYAENGGIGNVAVGTGRITLSPNPAPAGSRISIAGAGIDAIEIYSLAGVRMATGEISADNAEIQVPDSPGTYIVNIRSGASVSGSVLFVR